METPSPLTPYATMLGFTRYIGRTGPARATFVGSLRRQRESGSGFNPHGPLVKALKADIQFRTRGTHLAQLPATVKPRWAPLYSALLPGAVGYLDSLGELDRYHLVRPRDALAMVGPLPVKINPHLAVRRDDGYTEVARLHFDEEPPGRELTLATLHLMGRAMQTLLPGGTPVLVDIRHGVVHRPEPGVREEQVERWLAGEAAAFSAMWQAAA